MGMVFIVDRRKQRYQSRWNMIGRLNGTRTGESGRESKRGDTEQEGAQAKRPRDQCSLATGRESSG